MRPVPQLPPIVNDVPLKAIEWWLNAPSINPKEEIVKRGARSLDAVQRSKSSSRAE